MPPPRPLPPARKAIGQHFLIDPNIVRKLITLSAVQPNEVALEIGPGRGVLTRALCEHAARVVAIEIDPQLVSYLKDSLGDVGNLDLRTGDARDFPYDTLPDNTVVVANLPYYVSTPLLFRLLESRGKFSRLVLMLQTEVAKRLVARPGTKDYGILSVLTQYRTEPSLAFRVSPGCFRPKPAVGSAVVHLLVRNQGAVEITDEELFVRTVRAAFAHRRKTLGNSLRDAGFSSESVAHALARAEIAPSRRAETLSLLEFGVLSNNLEGLASA